MKFRWKFRGKLLACWLASLLACGLAGLLLCLFAACLLISRPKLSAPPEAACMPYLHPQSGKHPLSGKRSSVSQESEGNPQGEVAARFWEAATSQ